MRDDNNAVIYVSPPDTPMPTAPLGRMSTDWTSLGHVAAGDGITIERDTVDWRKDWWDEEIVRTDISSTEYTLTVDPFAHSRALMELYYGVDPAVPRHAVLFTYDIPYDVPVAPRKGWLRGKAYRRARRSYARELRAWKRAGSPTTSKGATYIPQATVRVR